MNDVTSYLSDSIAPTTRRTYNSGFRSYERFCDQHSLPIFPLREDVLELYVCSLARRKLAFATIKVYLSATQYRAILQGYAHRIAQMDRLFYVMRGIRRRFGTSRNRPRRLPLTMDLLRQFFTWLTNILNHYDASLIQAASALAFFGLLRSAEYTSPGRHYYNSSTLQLSDVHFRNGLMLVTIKESKTDPFKVGCIIRVASTGLHTCPFRAMRRYLRLRPDVSGPLLIFQDGSFLTRNYLSQLIKRCFPGHSLDTHSFRIGGASAAASNGIEDSTIQILGRWSSDAYRRYIHLSDERIYEAAASMARNSRTFRIWDSSLTTSTSL